MQSENQIDGIVVSNTTISRDQNLKNKHAAEVGGLSGRPLFQKSNEVLKNFYKFTDGKILLVGVKFYVMLSLSKHDSWHGAQNHASTGSHDIGFLIILVDRCELCPFFKQFIPSENNVKIATNKNYKLTFRASFLFLLSPPKKAGVFIKNF